MFWHFTVRRVDLWCIYYLQLLLCIFSGPQKLTQNLKLFLAHVPHEESWLRSGIFFYVTSMSRSVLIDGAHWLLSMGGRKSTKVFGSCFELTIYNFCRLGAVAVTYFFGFNAACARYAVIIIIIIISGESRCFRLRAAAIDYSAWPVGPHQRGGGSEKELC